MPSGSKARAARAVVCPQSLPLRAMATVTASSGGVNVIGCEIVVPYENEGIENKATRSKVFVSLSFTLYPEEED